MLSRKYCIAMNVTLDFSEDIYNTDIFKRGSFIKYVWESLSILDDNYLNDLVCFSRNDPCFLFYDKTSKSFKLRLPDKYMYKYGVNVYVIDLLHYEFELINGGD